MTIQQREADAFHRLTREFGALGPSDDIVVRNGKVEVRRPFGLCQHLQRFIEKIGTRLGITPTENVAAAISRIFMVHKMDIRFDDLAGLVGAANYIISRSQSDPHARECTNQLLEIQREVHPLFKIPKDVLLKIVGLSVASGSTWSKSFQALRQVCKSTRDQLPMSCFFQQSQRILKMITPWRYGSDFLDTWVQKKRYTKFITNQIETGNLESASSLFFAYHNHQSTTAGEIGSLLSMGLEKKDLEKWLILFQKIGREVTKFAFVQIGATPKETREFLLAILPHLPHIQSLFISMTIFRESPADFTKALNHCLNIEDLFIRTAGEFKVEKEQIFAKLTNLKRLDYFFDQPNEELDGLSEFPATSIQTLSILLSGGKIRRLPQLGNFKKLQALHMPNFTLGRGNIRALRALPPLHTLELGEVKNPSVLLALELQASLEVFSLELSSRNITNEAVIAMLKRHTRLKDLAIKNNLPFRINELANVLQSCKSLECVELNAIVSNASEVATLIELLCFYPHLTDLKTIRFQDRELHELFTQQYQKFPSLAHQKIETASSPLT